MLDLLWDHGPTAGQQDEKVTLHVEREKGGGGGGRGSETERDRESQRERVRERERERSFRSFNYAVITS
jgi:hypothetical protein